MKLLRASKVQGHRTAPLMARVGTSVVKNHRARWTCGGSLRSDLLRWQILFFYLRPPGATHFYM